mmetsp:Transcript_27242/g.60185  ORF Transcript_27242/g.60185 Transcript_27242/m.60185 type:complete len:288 (-) Transcript_27242:446-1309(-)
MHALLKDLAGKAGGLATAAFLHFHRRVVLSPRCRCFQVPVGLVLFLVLLSVLPFLVVVCSVPARHHPPGGRKERNPPVFPGHKGRLDADEERRKATDHRHAGVEPPDLGVFPDDHRVGKEGRRQHRPDEGADAVLEERFRVQRVGVSELDDRQGSKDKDADDGHFQDDLHVLVGFRSLGNVVGGGPDDAGPQQHQDEGNRHAGAELTALEGGFLFLGHRTGGPEPPEDHHRAQKIDAVLESEDEAHGRSRHRVIDETGDGKNSSQNGANPTEHKRILAGRFTPTIHD